ncbi:uncharacterized protein CYBJADRAFT_87231 [Cyberlindnera jadinii NRRL Y-1542]|uniref:Uncharacterized protein n=1 Tax=Cyberlindnera jadinii (strain ATCC 18201 / CBS 1600 / BCRC 20928 / JCM 3617 / NBRC 0987 / NRRL Y-1542) TaxID=983966 RepID=A0A1E4S264_CYBJN|nr:hypothetical protein CYBJADRAFT_87231 [Cyberlindnera jadinii NRRL Y-1542]ODV73614.1 hypothetical protein CYBJADRAFT_87231 [Cyberlindnera jadinii NRRL Y-1542]
MDCSSLFTIFKHHLAFLSTVFTSVVYCLVSVTNTTRSCWSFMDIPLIDQIYLSLSLSNPHVITFHSH